jgi:hypothetical protein
MPGKLAESRAIATIVALLAFLSQGDTHQRRSPFRGVARCSGRSPASPRSAGDGGRRHRPASRGRAGRQACPLPHVRRSLEAGRKPAGAVSGGLRRIAHRAWAAT